MTENIAPLLSADAAPEMNSPMAEETGTVVLASRLLRLGACLLDALISCIIFFVPLYFVCGSWSAMMAMMRQETLGDKITGWIFSGILYWVLNGYLLAKSGQTIGKKMLGIKIVRSDGSLPALGHLLFRRWLPVVAVQMIPYVGGLLALVDACAIFRDSRKCLHDQIADTIVVLE
jgi:uncharacterized RDD family membrane protein YckC